MVWRSACACRCYVVWYYTYVVSLHTVHHTEAKIFKFRKSYGKQKIYEKSKTLKKLYFQGMQKISRKQYIAEEYYEPGFLMFSQMESVPEKNLYLRNILSLRYLTFSKMESILENF